MPRAKTARNGNSESTTTAAAVQPAPVPEMKASPAPLVKTAPAAEVKVVSPTPAAKPAPVPEVKAPAPSPKPAQVPMKSAEAKVAESKRNGTPQDLEGEIRTRAYQLYEARGCTPGHEGDDWVVAEREIIARYSHSTA
jgi:Protein of unknown function (DUF2934)